MSLADAAWIRSAIAELTRCFNAGDADGMMRFYADRVMAGGRARLDVSVADVQVIGDLAYAWGDLLFIAPDGDGGERRAELRYLEIWRRFDDGWKSVCGMDAEARVA